MKIDIQKALILSFLIGLCDVSAGIMLLSSPTLTLALMGIQNIPTELVYMQFVGAFVLSVGAIYWLPFVASREEKLARLCSIWQATALVRFVVMVFVLTKVSFGDLEVAWLLVALTDGAIALFQTVVSPGGKNDV